MTDSNAPHNDQLSAADAAAVDALIEAGFDLQRVPVALRERARKAGEVLGLLDGAVPATSQTLIDVTLARVLRADMVETDAVLCAEDAEALDALVAAEFRVAKVPGSLRPRAEKLDSIARLIAETPTSGSSLGLAEQTMRRLATDGRRGQLDPIPIRSGGRFRMADLVSIAAVLLMGIAVVWPVLSTMRTYKQKSECAANLGTIASAMGQYTGDNRESFPMASASFGGSWLNVGSTPDRSNSANLYTLARTGYTNLGTLACDGNPQAVRTQPVPGATDWQSLSQVSYSYYIMFGDARPTPVSSPHTIILADRSPVVMQAATGGPVKFPNANSPNHAGKGQWALRADGTAVWLASPLDGGDNIWLTREQQAIWDEFQRHLPELRRQAPKGTKGFLIEVPMFGNELPQSDSDSFLGP